MQWYKLGADLWGSSLAEKDQGILVKYKLNVSQHCALLAKKANSVLSCLRKCTASR